MRVARHDHCIVERSKIWPMRSLAETDPEIAAAIHNETHRQADGLELIASENVVSRAILEAAGSVMTNKYAEGYPGRRYYGGCEFVDVAESLAISRAKQLFGADHANVQPHSGAQANAPECAPDNAERQAQDSDDKAQRALSPFDDQNQNGHGGEKKPERVHRKTRLQRRAAA